MPREAPFLLAIPHGIKLTRTVYSGLKLKYDKRLIPRICREKGAKECTIVEAIDIAIGGNRRAKECR